MFKTKIVGICVIAGTAVLGIALGATGTIAVKKISEKRKAKKAKAFTDQVYQEVIDKKNTINDSETDDEEANNADD